MHRPRQPGAQQGVDTGKLCATLAGTRGDRRAYDIGPTFSDSTAFAIVEDSPEGWKIVTIRNVDPSQPQVPVIDWPLEVGDAVLVSGLGQDDCLSIREQPTQEAARQNCMPDGTRATATDFTLSESTAAARLPQIVWTGEYSVAWDGPAAGESTVVELNSGLSVVRRQVLSVQLGRLVWTGIEHAVVGFRAGTPFSAVLLRFGRLPATVTEKSKRKRVITLSDPKGATLGTATATCAKKKK